MAGDGSEPPDLFAAIHRLGRVHAPDSLQEGPLGHIAPDDLKPVRDGCPLPENKGLGQGLAKATQMKHNGKEVAIEQSELIVSNVSRTLDGLQKDWDGEIRRGRKKDEGERLSSSHSKWCVAMNAPSVHPSNWLSRFIGRDDMRKGKTVRRFVVIPSFRGTGASLAPCARLLHGAHKGLSYILNPIPHAATLGNVLEHQADFANPASSRRNKG